MKDKLERIRFYLDYVEEHYYNVQKAFRDLVSKCKDMEFVKDEYRLDTLMYEVANHDLSKLSAAEFIQYQEKHYPCDTDTLRKKDIRYAFKIAFKHHKENNLHHVETWTNRKFEDLGEWQVHCVHMIIDWMAMGYKFGDTAYDFYRKIEKNLKLSDEAIDLIDKVFQRLYGKTIKVINTDAF